MTSDGTAGGWLIDAHVHLHAGVAAGDLLDHAARGMAGEAARAGLAPSAGMLMLTESAGVESLDAFRAAEGWTVEPTGEAVSLAARRDGCLPVFVVAGRQIVTADGLEVHALGTLAQIADGQAMAATLAAVRGAGAVAVLPWGVGKWLGRRGAIVTALAADVSAEPGLCLADSGVRAWPLARPSQLAAAEVAGRSVLAGSDPLPLAGEVSRVGRYGVIAPALDPAAPLAAFRNWLSGGQRPAIYGRLERTDRFLRHQLAMQLAKRLRPRR